MAGAAGEASLTPNGASTLSKRSRAYVEGVSPTCYTRARGCRLWDADEHAYIDWCMALSAVPLGYGYPHVTEAVIRAAENGWVASLPTHLEAEVGEAFLSHIPCARDGGMVKWVNDGSEAGEVAIRVARRVTGRDVSCRAAITAGCRSSWCFRPCATASPPTTTA